MYLLLVMLFLSTNLTFSSKLPSYFKKCDHTNNFNECIKSNIENSFDIITNRGDKSLKLPKLNPIFIKETKLEASPQLTILFNDANFFGVDTVKFNTINMDLDKMELNMNFLLEIYGMDGIYDLNGRIMILPIQGNGHIFINTTGGINEFTAKLEIVKKGNDEFYKITEYSDTFDPKSVFYQLDNLFDGNVQLGTEMNKFLNDNWSDVFQEVRAGFETVLGLLVANIINIYFAAIPISELYS